MKPKLFYTAPNAKCGDIIPKYVDGKYQLFYLKHWLDRDAPDFVPGWHRMESDDLVHMGSETPMSFRMYDYQNRNLGLFSFGKAEFSQIEMREREYE
ncbi:hypothetical protein [Acutalibacter muris]|uniref:hypothetical protein n=1 Tax=Acutalibacter muris TaxID=1796620 RepID=UPI00272996CB|nr:hypothetical protein [Acutalibacter muris]